MKKIRKENIDKLLKELSRKFEVIVPVEEDGGIYFRAFKPGVKIAKDYVNSNVSPKQFFIPEKEILFEFSESSEGVKLEPDYDSRSRLIYGIRPCDVNALLILDKVARADFEDSYYLKRRDNTILIAVDCINPGSECFCSSFGAGPFLDKGADLVFTDLGKHYLVDARSEEGRALVKESSLFTDAEKKDKIEAEKKMRDALKKLKYTELNELKPESLKEASRRCVSCYSCTFVCPTCYCFDVVDRMDVSNNSGKRMRCWDSCMSPSFTKMAGGVNPRGDKLSRFRNRFNHKFRYMPDRFDSVGCVGCGRCSLYCPSGISVFNLLREVKE